MYDTVNRHGSCKSCCHFEIVRLHPSRQKKISVFSVWGSVRENVGMPNCTTLFSRETKLHGLCLFTVGSYQSLLVSQKQAAFEDSSRVRIERFRNGF